MVELNKCARGGLAVLCVFALISAGHARPDARTMTCSQIQALLDREGAVVISTGPNTFDLFVSGQAGCSGTEVARATSIAASDTSQCQVYRCQSRIRGPRR
jgi:hypothetical protein